MPSGGQIRLRTTNVDLPQGTSRGLASGRYVMLTVADTGGGMNAETISHIFEPFFSAKPHSRQRGIGLSAVYDIVVQAHGDIWVQSEPGKGAAFTICLPRTD